MLYSIRTAVLVLSGLFVMGVQGRSESSRIPVVTQYEFVQEPRIHRLSHAADDGDNNQQKKRSFSEGLELGHLAATSQDIYHLQLQAHNTTYSLVLEPNADLIHPSATQSRAHNGSRVIEPVRLDDIGVYRGHVLRVGGIERLENSGSLRKWELARRRQMYSFDEQATWVRLSVYRDGRGRAVLDGAFGMDGEVFYIKPVHTYGLTKRREDPQLANPYAREERLRLATSIIYRQQDLASGGGGSCGSHRLAGNMAGGRAAPPRLVPGDPLYPLRHSGGWLAKRSSSSFDNSQAALKAGCKSDRQVLYMGAAADCSYVTKYQSQDGARQQILSDWNLASAAYERQLNVGLELVQLEIEDLTCPGQGQGQGQIQQDKQWNRGCSEQYTIERRLSDFSVWRGARGKDGCGLWHLMTDCPTGTEVGLAWMGTLCMTEASGMTAGGSGVSSGTGVSAASRDEWKVVAHEIGHNFGASHDCTERECPCASQQQCRQCCPCAGDCNCGGKYIMNPTSPVSSDDFSPCSVKDMCGTIASSGPRCLMAPGSKTSLSSHMCGNGIKEEGEECDCGTSEECQRDQCCDAKTCKLKPGAQCADVNDQCCEQCKVRAKGAVCRPKYSDCDVQEVCDGQSADCPSDRHIADGTACSSADTSLKCASGQCTSRDAQCTARGGYDGLTKHCALSNSDPCEFLCTKPGSSFTCTIMSGSFIDGTVCGFHAKCRAGQCKGDNGFYQFLLLFQRNLAASIPITIAIVLVVAAVLWCVCCRVCGCCRPPRKYVPKRLNTMVHGRQPPEAQLQPLPLPQHDGRWVDPSPYNGSTGAAPDAPQYYHPPPQPPLPPPHPDSYPMSVLNSSHASDLSSFHQPSRHSRISHTGRALSRY